MTIIDLISIVSGGASIAGGVDVIRKHFTNSTPEDLFKKSFVDAVKQLASSLAHVADPKTIKADKNRLDQVLASLKDSDLTELVLLNKNEKLLKVTELFQECIKLPGHQLTPEQLVQRLQPVIERTITNFYERLPRNQQAANQIMLEIEPQESFSEFPKRFPDDEGLWSIKLNDSSDNVPKATDSTSIQPILEFTDKQHEALLQIKNVYKEHLPQSELSWVGQVATP